MTNDWHRGDWMQTFTGLQFYPLSPRPEDVEPSDIAHALGMLCRYNGHVDAFYSVAEHCVLMSHAVSPENALAALLHDATEAYVGDMIRPLKRSMPDYVAVEDRVMVAIARRFGLPLTAKNSQAPQGTDYAISPAAMLAVPDEFIYVMPAEVKDADSRILLTERAALMRGMQSRLRWGVDDLQPLPVRIRAWSPDRAELEYRQRLDELLPGVFHTPFASIEAGTR
jgi:hypothetical protein